MPGIEPCPLCNMPASFTETRLPFEGRRFECSQCKRFVIDAATEAHLSALPEFPKSEQRRALAELSMSAGPGQRAIIRAPHSGDKLAAVPVDGTNEVIAYIE